MIISKVLYQKFFLTIGVTSLNQIDNHVEIEDTLFNKDIFLIVETYIFDEIIRKKIAEYRYLNSLFFNNVTKINEIECKINKINNILLFPLKLFYKSRVTELNYNNIMLEMTILKLTIGETN